MLARDHKKRLRSGQTRERIPSNAWARKIAAPTKPITAVIVSNIANVLYATARQRTAATLHSQKDFRAPTHDRSRILCNRRASSCDPAPRICDFAPGSPADRMRPAIAEWRALSDPVRRAPARDKGRYCGRSARVLTTVTKCEKL